VPIVRGMSRPEEPQPGNDEPPPKPSRLEEARRIIEEYAADLREIIKKIEAASVGGLFYIMRHH
jgi:hypothetical protein